MFKHPAIINNYVTGLYDEPIRGLRNFIAYSDNSGNILFLDTIGKQIEHCTPINLYTDFMEHPDQFVQKYDAFVLPMANMVSSTWRSTAFLDLLEKYSIPVILVSIGIQASEEADLIDFNLSPDAKRLLDIAKDRSHSIGVRGQYTAEILDNLGYPVKIIGCPSVFARKTSQAPRCSSDPKQIATHATLSGKWREELTHLFEFSRKYSQSYIAQSELRFFVNCFDISDATLEEWIPDPVRLGIAKDRLYEYKYYSQTEQDAQDLYIWMKKSLRYFTDVESWVQHLAQFELVVGTRFHGTIMGLLAGTPSLLLTTDLRVRELSDYHRIPHAPISILSQDTTPRDLVQYVNYDEYWAFKDYAHTAYLDFLQENKLNPVN